MRPLPSDACARPETPPASAAPYAAAPGGLRLRVQVTPRARTERVGGLAHGGRGPRLRLSVTAPPHDGEANAAVVALLARTLRLPKSAFAVSAGAGQREKTIAVRGDAAALAAAIDALVAASGEAG